ncbi:MAG: M56 family metallopeptidase [Sedimentisphaerales bacterium]|nr:M56 family metallopeptidase [Sedimentisphaerales bacterium]
MDTFITFMNAAGRSFVGFSSSMLIQSSLLIIILLILDALIRKKVRLVFLYGIWMLVLVKLVLPTTFSSPVGLGYWFGDKAPQIIVKTDYIPEKIDSMLQKAKPDNRMIPFETETATLPLRDISINPNSDVSAEFTVEAAPATASLSWQGFVLLFWSAVVTAMVLYLIWRMLFIRNLLSQSKRPDDSIMDMFEQCRKQIGVNRPVLLELSPVAVSPSVCGLFRPKILIPQSLPRKLKTEDLRPIFLHELAHIKRDDLWISLIQTILQIVYFYNPLLWVANVTIRKVREQAVDEAVLVALGEKAEDYPETLLNISRMTFGRPKLSLRLIGIVESKKALERRIMIMLNKPVPKSSKLGYLGLVAIVVIGSVILPMGYNPIEQPVLAAPADDALSVEKIIIPGHRVGDFTFNTTEDDMLEALGRPKKIFYEDQEYTFDNLPRKYFMLYDDLSFLIVDDKVKGITVLSPSYKFPNRIKVGDSEQKVKKAFGEDFKLKEGRGKDFLSYKDENIMFEIHKQDRTVMEINISPSPASELYRKADIPSTTYINEKGRLVDKVDYPFVDDPKVTGGWKSVDFVREIKDFDPDKKNWGGKLWLNHLIFEEGGTIHGGGGTWTRGLVLGDDTASKYILKEIDGSAYMFYEWKSGDYTIRYMKPFYYVLKKVSLEQVKHEPMYGYKADIPETSYINDEGHIVDKIDWPFVDDPQLVGTWESVDFVDKIEEFKPGEKNWRHGLYLEGLIFKPDGKTFKPWWTWTKGLIFHSGDKTAGKYTIKEIDGSTYMFFEWKSGDYTIRYRKPSYYVLKKVSSKTSGPLDKKWISRQEDDENNGDDEDEENEEFTEQLPAKIRQLDIDTAGLKEVIKILGEPIKYIWGKETFSEDNLPKRYILVYPSRFRVFMSDNKIVEIRHESGFKYVFRDKLRFGSTLEEVFEVAGHPEKIVRGEENKFEDGVLYKDIDGTEGHCYYARYDQDVRFWFWNYKLIAIYMTRSDYGEN